MMATPKSGGRQQASHTVQEALMEITLSRSTSLPAARRCGQHELLGIRCDVYVEVGRNQHFCVLHWRVFSRQDDEHASITLLYTHRGGGHFDVLLQPFSGHTTSAVGGERCETVGSVSVTNPRGVSSTTYVPDWAGEPIEVPSDSSGVSHEYRPIKRCRLEAKQQCVRGRLVHRMNRCGALCFVDLCQTSGNADMDLDSRRFHNRGRQSESLRPTVAPQGLRTNAT